MTEEIAHVSGSTADTPGHVGRVSNVLNQTTTGGRIGPQPETETAEQTLGETQWNNTHTNQSHTACTTHIAPRAGANASTHNATKGG